ncbi:Hypothetical protein GbCGDNIH9_8641 [Granulibacter bethesdensis]|uniref:Uncharacterized protein n=1 Tax=Granulibacter bethesdensis TaxID=364410 RepID=A0AAC9P903_9PROT|nr:hypothetical protein [Granulibacter bethesdensis]APH55086.1 Hypothetical protein GbCGDNIH9_8641 [Granulibacter bethesdensis]APH62672.1 Hypothetical protein GbCGDNIH8_8641 [Granulibacter bethesdensis]
MSNITLCPVHQGGRLGISWNVDRGEKSLKPHIEYRFHHMGIPTDQSFEGEVFSAAAGMFTSDNQGKFRIQWHRFLPTSPLHPLIRTVPHPAFKVSDLEAAIEGEHILLGPYEPIDGYFVAIIDDGGVPVELIQTNLDDDEIWRRAKTGEGSLYRNAALHENAPDRQ